MRGYCKNTSSICQSLTTTTTTSQMSAQWQKKPAGAVAMESMLDTYVKYMVEVEGVVLNDLDSRVQSRVAAMRTDMVKMMGGKKFLLGGNTGQARIAKAEQAFLDCKALLWVHIPDDGDHSESVSGAYEKMLDEMGRALATSIDNLGADKRMAALDELQKISPCEHVGLDRRDLDLWRAICCTLCTLHDQFGAQRQADFEAQRRQEQNLRETPGRVELQQVWDMCQYQDAILEEVFWAAERGVVAAMPARQVSILRQLVTWTFGTRGLNSPHMQLHVAVADLEQITSHLASTQSVYKATTGDQDTSGMLEPGDVATSYFAHILSDCGHKSGSVPQTPLLLTPCAIFAAFQEAPTAYSLENVANKLFAHDMTMSCSVELHGRQVDNRHRHGAPVTEVHQSLGLNCSPYKDFSRAIVHNTQLGMILGFDRYAATNHVARDKLLNHSRNCKTNGYSYDYLVVVHTLAATK